MKKLKKEIIKLEGFRHNNRYFLLKVIEHYSDFFEKFDSFTISEDSDYDYSIEIYIETSEEEWLEFKKISEKLKIQWDAPNETTLILFE